MTTRTGGCACGAVRYEISAEPVFQVACHCRTCQRTTGGSPTMSMAFPAVAMTVTKGEALTWWSKGDSGAEIGRSFCEACGSPLFSGPKVDADMTFVRVGSLDDPSAFAPQVNIYVSDAQPWHPMTPGIPQFEAMPG